MERHVGEHALVPKPFDYAGAVSALLAQGNVQGFK
jgi:hypothetical protein